MRLLVVGASSLSTKLLLEAAHALGAEVTVVAAETRDKPCDCAIVDLDAALNGDASAGIEVVRSFASRDVPVIAVGAKLSRADVLALFGAGAADVIAAPLHKRELILRLSATMHRKLRVACIGGGTGLFVVLSGMKDEPRLLLSSIVTMSDDGGSSGRRTTFGMLPPGDIRRSLVALSNAPDVMSYIMQFRFKEANELTGHSLGNLLLTALTQYTGGMPNAVKALGDLLNVQGIVMCVAEESMTLCAEFTDGRVVRGESAIDQCLERPADLRITRVWQEPSPPTSIDVLASIIAADLVVIGPGDLYTSVLSGLVVDGVADAIRASRGKRLYVCNLMTKPGETHDYDVADHVTAITNVLGPDAIDHVIVSRTPLDPSAIEAYAAKEQHPVALDLERFRQVSLAELIECDVGDRALLVRHDAEKLRTQLVSLIHRNWPSKAVPAA